MDLKCFEEFPLLETDRLVLRKHTYDDLEDVFNIMSNFKVIRFMGLDEFKTYDDAKTEIDWYNSIYNNKTGLRWGITEKNDNTIIGSCGFKDYKVNSKKVEIGYELKEEYWKKGIMTEALKEIIKYGFENMYLNRIEAEVDKRNFSSLNVLFKLGFQIEGVKRESEFENGEYIDLVILSLLEREYKKTK